jgi:hypothetical protein
MPPSFFVNGLYRPLKPDLFRVDPNGAVQAAWWDQFSPDPQWHPYQICNPGTAALA